MITLIIFQCMGCKYYKVDEVGKKEYVNILNIGEIHKYFIVHAGDRLYALNDIEANESVVSGTLVNTDEKVFYSKERERKRIKEEEKNIVNEVHLYLGKEYQDLELGTVEIPLTDISEIRIIDRNTGKEIGVYALVGIGAIAIISAIVAMTKSSCPYVYVHNGENFVFEGEAYGGAIGKNLERTDYMPLPSLKITDNNYRIRMSNELQERQYTNLIEMIVVKHEPYERVLLDKKGNPHLIHDLTEAEAAYSSNGENINSLLAKKDDKFHLFNDENYSINKIVLEFERPEEANQANLVINCKNTLWFDYLFGEFLEKFGRNYSSWMQNQFNTTSEIRMQSIIDNHFPLFVFIEKNGEWKMVDYLLTVGPLASRDFVIPIDLSDYWGDDIRVKLETGFMFWEVDCAAMGFGEDKLLQKKTLKPYLATGTGAMDWKYELEYSDNLYMEQENIGDITEIVFAVTDDLHNSTHSTFLKTRGYYELIRSFTGFPEWSNLNKFKVPGHFSDFSRERFLEVTNKDYDIAVNSLEY
ncbi:hypothetical protein [Lutimonas zeaxanthinifaciens]|uniref:hypothetical protein n=1 Tax=Lutimonas zeaxanthinifaciens TaxID=3060215 RepID=UPI00265D2B8C|nr:hypothetical protein [Lutimonas sp. YSD2104]WKK65687.1 hypothetical protein QZH61_13990 [Lutimonas sp. YSD2104]